MDVAKNSPYVELPAFQGPLDLLLHLIKQEKVDIYDIPIAKIADQFIQALKQMESLDMEVTSEFLVLAAQLLYIKSRLLLPKPPKEMTEVEEDPRKELVERLIAYKAYKDAAETLSTLQRGSGSRYFREVAIEEIMAQFPQEDPLQGIKFEDLWIAFHKIVERANDGEEIQYMEPEDISIEMLTVDVLRRILLNPKGVCFSELIRRNSRMEMVISFLAVLELLKTGKVCAEQSRHWGEIFLLPTEKASEFA